ncbi:MAG TPA: hypothetical protein VJH23_02650 [archaeon]|nr:hypothetical protein [archaeon]
METKLLAFGALLLLMLGCVQTPGTGTNTEFSLGVPFTVTEGKAYSTGANQYDLSGLKIEVISFTDSRCPVDVQCIWAGEVGVNLKVSQSNLSGNYSEEIYLGETTVRSKAVLDPYVVNLQSVDFEKKEAVIVVSAYQAPSEQSAWFTYKPTQCLTNPWEGDNWPVKRLFADEEDRVTAWFSIEQGIEALDFASKEADEGTVVCEACSCQRGDTIALLVESKDFAKMQSLGWQKVTEPIACTMDARICPDGSAVGRTAPFCQFEACLGEEPTGQQEWFSFSPIQCGGNEWELWHRQNLVVDGDPFTENEVISIWLNLKYGITAMDYSSHIVSEIVCLACSCPRGDEIAVLVDSKDSVKMQALGWTQIEGKACTEEAKLCSDGSYVGREGPWCEFAACPKIDFLAQKIDQPGFEIDPVQKSTTIYSNGIVVVKTTALREGNSTTETFLLSAAKVSELSKFIAASKVFEITEEDARMCMIDGRTKDLTVSIDGKEAHIQGIGAECEKENLKAAYDVLAKIDSVMKSAVPTASIEV